MKPSKNPSALRSLALAGCLLAGPGLATAAALDAGLGYHLLKSVPLPGDGKGDFITLDQETRRLYVTHADGVQVLDADSLRLIGTIEGVPHSHGVLPMDPLGKVYVTSGVPGSVVVADAKSFRHLAEVPSKPDTDVVIYDPASGHVITFNGDSHDATVIDPSTDKMLKQLELGGDPEVAVADGKGFIFDNLESASEVIRINSKTLDIDQRWPVAPGDTPSGLALDRRHHRLFIGCRNKLLVVMDSTNGKVIQSLPIGDHIDTTAFDPKSGTVFNSCGDGTLSVVHQDGADRYHVVEDATMAYDAQTDRVFLSTAVSGPPPAASKDDPKPGRSVVPGSFHLLVMGK